MSARKQISLYLSKEDLDLIDNASKKESRTRSSFMTFSAKERAKEILHND